MIKEFFIVLVFVSFGLSAQNVETPYKSKKIIATRDTISIDSTSVNASFFKLVDANSKVIDSTFY